MKYNITWKNICFIGCAMSVVCGLIAIFFPLLIMKSFSLIVGTAVLLFGVASLYNGLSQIDVLIIGQIKIVFSVICIIIVILFLVNPETPYKIFAIFFGMWSMSIGLFKINLSLNLKKTSEKYFICMINGVINVLFGVIIIFCPIATVQVWTQIFGGYLIFLGINLFCKTFKINNF